MYLADILSLFTMFIGYARVSTQDQSLDLQTDALKEAGCKKVFTDTISGKNASRPQLDKLKEHCRKGDTVVVWRLDRLGRSLKDLIEIINFFDSQGIAFKSLHENIDTSTSSGKLIFHIFGALAEFERNLIVDRTKAGLEAARKRGIKGGRKHKLTSAQQKTLQTMYDSKNHTVKEICETLNISKPTLYKYLEIRKPATQN
jgi:DNA invertase Pin-like site-specific DNA recombinase